MAKPKTPPKPSKNPPKPDTDEEDPSGEGGEGEDDDEDDDRRINAIVTNRVNRALKPLSKQIADLTAALAASAKKPEPGEGEGEGDDEDEESPPPKRASKASAGESKKLSALEKRVKDAEDRASKAEQAQKEQSEKALRAEEDGAIGVALQKAGFTDPKVIRAITLSLRADELIVRDEETGKVRFKSVDKYGSEDLVDPDSGLGKWLKSDGKSFLPAVAASGSGAGGSNLQQTQQSKLTKTEIGKLSPREKAQIDLERASQGLPPLGHD